MLVADYGAPGLRIWLEILSISDRAGPYIDCTSEGAIRRLSSAAETRFKVVSSVVDTLIKCDSMRIHDRINHVTEIVNYWDYHRSEERKPRPTDLTDPTRPNQTIKDTDDPPEILAPAASTPRPDLSVQDLVDSWNANFGAMLPKVEWPLSTSRHRKAAMRLKEHRNLEFWTKVFGNISESQFLLGKNNGTWRCTLDFLIANDSNVLKIYEGTYNGKQGSSQSTYRR